MNNNNKITIVIPVYNSQKYLNYCINSVLNQTYDNYDLLLIDDGSTDESGKICDDYATMHDNVTVIHNKNVGVSETRNIGINKANANFITFLDGDDWLEKDALETLIGLTKNSNSLVCGSMRDIWPHANVKRCFLDTYYDRSSKDCDSFFKDVTGTACGMLFDLKLIKDNNIYFPTDMKNGEDSYFLSKYLLFANEIVTTSKVVYNYNKLEKNTAVSKYYEETYNWRYKQAKAQIEALSSWNVNDKELINTIIVSRFEESLINYLYANDNQKLIDTYNAFKNELILVDKNIKILGLDTDSLIESFNNNDFSKIKLVSTNENKIKEAIKDILRFFKTKKYAS